MTRKAIFSAVFVVLILVAGAILWLFQRGAIFYKDGSFGFSKTAITNPKPDLNRDTTFPADFSPEAKQIFEDNVTKLRATLAEDPVNYEAWLDLAIYYRMVGDHNGAVEIWNYVKGLYPQDGITRHNLGEYYFHTKLDYEEAEKHYRESILVQPSLQSNYTDLYDMYRYVYKQDTNAATDILLEGIEKAGSPANISLMIILGRHYRDVLGDRSNARVYLTQARDAAQAEGNRSIANELSREILAL